MPKPKGPPYVDDPECQYVVIGDPWPGGRDSSNRDARYFDKVAFWLFYMLGEQASPDTIYYVKTRNDLIVKFEEGVDLSGIFGMHFWPNFLKISRPPAKFSFIFEYNYRRHGRPEFHRWAEYFPPSRPPSDWGEPPIKRPYPAPAWVSHSGLSCTEFALPIRDQEAKPRSPSPKPPPSPKPENVHRRETLADLMSDEPRAVQQRPGPAVGLPSQVKQEPATAQPSRLYMDKLDPYDEEDQALLALKAEPTDAPLRPEVPIKQESNATMEAEPEADSEEISAELQAAIDLYNQSRSQSVRFKEEVTEPEGLGHSDISPMGATVKAEPRDHGITPPNGASHLGTSRADVGEMSRQAVINRVKSEPQDQSLSTERRISDPRVRPSSSDLKRPKVEEETEKWADSVKRRRP